MIVKSALIACAAATAASLPLALPMASGRPVALSVGALVFEFDRDRWVDVDLDPSCLVRTCPLAELRIGGGEAPVYLIGL